MPSQIAILRTTNPDWKFFQDATVVAAGVRCAQLIAVTVPAEIVGAFGIRVGRTGDPMRINREGVAFEFDGPDATGGIFAVWLIPGVLPGAYTGPGTFTAEFLIVQSDEEAA